MNFKNRPCKEIYINPKELKKLNMDSYENFLKVTPYINKFNFALNIMMETISKDMVSIYDFINEKGKLEIEDEILFSKNAKELYKKFISEFKDRFGLDIKLEYTLDKYCVSREIDSEFDYYWAIPSTETHDVSELGEDLLSLSCNITQEKYSCDGSPYFVNVIDFSDLAKLDLKSYLEFSGLLSEYKLTVDSFIQSYATEDCLYINDEILESKCEDVEIVEEKIYASFKNLTSEFKNKYKMDIYPEYHNSRTFCSKYDTIDGSFLYIHDNDFLTLNRKSKMLSKLIDFENITYSC